LRFLPCLRRGEVRPHGCYVRAEEGASRNGAARYIKQYSTIICAKSSQTEGFERLPCGRRRPPQRGVLPQVIHQKSELIPRIHIVPRLEKSDPVPASGAGPQSGLEDKRCAPGNV